MTFFNPFGLVFMILIMIPNIIYAVKRKKNGVNDFSNLPQTKFWKIQQVFEWAIYQGIPVFQAVQHR